MKKTIIILAAIILFISCGDKKKSTTDNATSTETNTTSNSDGDSEKTGEFSIDGKSVAGRVTTQYFSSDKEKSNFSVLCQHDESATSANFELLQTTFITEKDAITNPNLKIYSGSMLPMTEPEPGIVTVSLSGVGSDLGDKPFVGSSKSTGSITISDRSLVIKDLTLYNSDGASKTVNAKIPF